MKCCYCSTRVSKEVRSSVSPFAIASQHCQLLRSSCARRPMYLRPFFASFVSFCGYSVLTFASLREMFFFFLCSLPFFVAIQIEAFTQRNTRNGRIEFHRIGSPDDSF